MPFTKGHPPYRSTKPGAYSVPRHRKEDYEPVDTVPEGLKWKPIPGGRGGPPLKEPSESPAVNRRRERRRRPVEPETTTLTSTPGSFYRLVRVRATGEVSYFKLKQDVAQMTPKDKIDAEPKKAAQIRFRKGALCWFVDTGARWYLCKVEDRTDLRIVLKSETGWDADKRSPWDYGELLEFPANPTNPLFQRLRPLKARYQ
jgi:hypothetical protein